MKKILGLVATVLVLAGCSTATWVNDAGWTCDGVSCHAPKAFDDNRPPADR